MRPFSVHTQVASVTIYSENLKTIFVVGRYNALLAANVLSGEGVDKRLR